MSVINLQEMDLIEVLWKQDVDLGFSLDRATNPAQDKQDNADESSQIIGPTTSISPIKDIDKCKDIEKNDKIKVCLGSLNLFLINCFFFYDFFK